MVNRNHTASKSITKNENEIVNQIAIADRELPVTPSRQKMSFKVAVLKSRHWSFSRIKQLHFPVRLIKSHGQGRITTPEQKVLADKIVTPQLTVR